MYTKVAFNNNSFAIFCSSSSSYAYFKFSVCSYKEVCFLATYEVFYLFNGNLILFKLSFEIDSGAIELENTIQSNVN